MANTIASSSTQWMTIMGEVFDLTLFMTDLEHFKVVLELGKDSVDYFWLVAIMLGINLTMQVCVMLLRTFLVLKQLFFITAGIPGGHSLLHSGESLQCVHRHGAGALEQNCRLPHRFSGNDGRVHWRLWQSNQASPSRCLNYTFVLYRKESFSIE